MDLITILLAVIAVTEMTRLVMTHKNISKKAHFKEKLKGTGRMIWDLEFKKFKIREMREDVRKEYDFTKARISSLENEMEGFKGDKEEKARMDDQMVLAKRDLERFESQLQSLDLEINGSKPNSQYPDGVSGLNDQIESLRALCEMLQAWAKEA